MIPIEAIIVSAPITSLPEAFSLSLVPANAPKTAKDREHRQQNAVCRAVQDTAREDRGGELEAHWAIGRIFSAKDSERHHRRRQKTEPDTPAPIAREVATRQPRVPGPARDEAGDGDGVQAVEEVAVQVEHVGQQERHGEGEGKAGDEPGPVTAVLGRPSAVR